MARFLLKGAAMGRGSGGEPGLESSAVRPLIQSSEVGGSKSFESEGLEAGGDRPVLRTGQAAAQVARLDGTKGYS